MSFFRSFCRVLTCSTFSVAVATVKPAAAETPPVVQSAPRQAPPVYYVPVQPIPPQAPPGYLYVPGQSAPPQAPPGYVLVPAQPLAQPSIQLRANTPAEAEGAPEEPESPPPWSVGLGVILLAHLQYLDSPRYRTVNVDRVTATDKAYPGFWGGGFAPGIAVDLRLFDTFGLELDLLYQNDRGTGFIKVRDRGDLCFIPSATIDYPKKEYQVTIGQNAIHVPLLMKLIFPTRQDSVVENGRRRWFRRTVSTLAFGPEFVFPESAELQLDPEGLNHPIRAVASNYVMYTAALGGEYRLSRRIDLRLVTSLRGSYNPEPKNSVQRRAEYGLEGGQVVAVAYRSEWRVQLAASLGLGWFF